jgi:hypothetical protein
VSAATVADRLASDEGTIGAIEWMLRHFTDDECEQILRLTDAYLEGAAAQSPTILRGVARAADSVWAARGGIQ